MKGISSTISRLFFLLLIKKKCVTMMELPLSRSNGAFIFLFRIPSFCQSVFLSVFVSLYVCQSLCVSVPFCWSDFPSVSICQSVFLSVFLCQFVFLSGCHSVSVFLIHQSVSPSVILSLSLYYYYFFVVVVHHTGLYTIS